MNDCLVRIETVSKRFGDVAALDGVSLEIGKGEFVALLGPSGCGKTTLMRLVAGFETPDSGRVLIDGVEMAGVAPYRRPVNMMFQSYALFPHMNVARNIGFGLVQAGMGRAEIAERVAGLLKLLRLDGMGARMPDQLSGGQKQRVALARALAPRPRLLLLDEPLGALDRQLREETQFELMALQRELGIAFLIVTHDQDEAMAMAQRIVLMNAGRIEQVGDARDIYERPASRFAAQFIGEINLFDVNVSRQSDGVRLTSAEAGGFQVTVASENGTQLQDRAAVGVRPEHMSLSHMRTGKDVEVEGIVGDCAYRGDSTIWRIDASGKILRIAFRNGESAAGLFQRGERVFAGFDRAAMRLLPP